MHWTGVLMKKYVLAAALAVSTIGGIASANAATVTVNANNPNATLYAAADGLYNITVTGLVRFAGGNTETTNDDRFANVDFIQRTVGGAFFDTAADGFDVGLQINGSLAPWNVFVASGASVYSITYNLTGGNGFSFLFRDRPGTYGDNAGSFEIAISAVPLPASMLGLLAGLAGLGFLRRRKTA